MSRIDKVLIVVSILALAFVVFRIVTLLSERDECEAGGGRYIREAIPIGWFPECVMVKD